MGTISLRFVEKDDAPFVQKYASSYDVAKTCLLPHPYPKNGGERWVLFALENIKNEKAFSFAILYEGSFAGVISLTNVDKDKGISNLGYWIGTPYWSKGICTHAISKAVEYAFKELGLSQINAECLEKNQASVKVLLNNGFTKVKEFILEDGKFIGEKCVLYRLSQ